MRSSYLKSAARGKRSARYCLDLVAVGGSIGAWATTIEGMA
jgi:hypothetical protein